ncbi:Outer membrane protein beta-barrel domain-containing protein [Granulicella rosea]|uniref:Outer membrane protein beta-barrel domain-containing protein n=1 Tax=Granulicella rosea TaxID=474952 RepID=A0A239M8J6_9BACT|nr:outer membrane beta-barrel protein [Granulicella rosea]SNT39257.1 Outer membrane protein beta-barrel domain-containing protein [Granulicella rosea]
MLKWSASLFGLAALLSLSSTLHAQASPTAIRGGGDIQAGVGVTFADGDYQNGTANNIASSNLGGVSFFANYGFTHSIGVEADVHLLTIYTPTDFSQKTYMIGPRYTYHRGKQAVYAKVIFGRGSFTYQEPQDPARKNPYFGNGASFNTYAFGGGYSYKIKPHYNLLVDVEDQKWPNFEPHTLSPLLVTVGVAYVIR